MEARIISHGGITLDLSTVKNFKVETTYKSGKPNVLTIEYKSRVEYIYNPETETYEKERFNDITKVEYTDYETACVYRDEWAKIWQDCLNEEL